MQQPCLYWDELPSTLPFQVEYILRLDTQPGAERLMAMDLTRLLRLYQHRKRNGTLPPRWQPPPRQQAKSETKTKIGHRESQRAVIERSRAVHPED
jgi:hypothetical protein